MVLLPRELTACIFLQNSPLCERNHCQRIAGRSRIFVRCWNMPFVIGGMLYYVRNSDEPRLAT